MGDKQVAERDVTGDLMLSSGEYKIPAFDGVVPAFGMINNDASCHFNALMQAILSSTNVTKYIYENKSGKDKPISSDDDRRDEFNHISADPKYMIYKGIKQALIGSPDSTLASRIIRFIAGTSAAKKAGYQISNQSACEGFTLFVDQVDLGYFYEFRYKELVTCALCKKSKTIICDEMTHFMLPIEDRFMNPKAAEDNTLRDYILEQRFTTDGYKCDATKGCPGIGRDILHIKRLDMIPECFTVLMPKYSEKMNLYMPDELRFVSKSAKGELSRKETNRVYRITALVEHSGSMGSGHYYAFVRRGDNCYAINDNTVMRLDKLTPTINTYMVFYEFVGIEKVADSLSFEMGNMRVR